MTELGKPPLIGSAPLLQSAEERSLGEWRVTPSILSSIEMLPVSPGSLVLQRTLGNIERAERFERWAIRYLKDSYSSS